jgi:branched-chain amino acid transport system substrate-binding protein
MKKISHYILSFIAVGLVQFSFLSEAYATDPQKPILNIGMAGPFTGSNASLGDMMKRGMEIAIEDINEKGGVLGRPIKPIIMDDRCDPKEAVSVANKLINYEVPVVIGHFCSGASIPTSDIYASSGILQISPASTNPKLTERDIPTVFRICGRDDAQGVTSAHWISTHYTGQNVAVVHDKQTYSKGLADSFKMNILKTGQNPLVLEETVNPGEKDFSSLITKLKRANAQVIYYGGYHPELGQILRQLQAQGMKPTVISGDAVGTSELWQVTGNAAEGMLFTQGANPQINPEASPLIEKLKKKNYPLEVYTFYTYAAMQSWTQAVEKAQSLDAVKVSEVMKNSSFKTVLGDLGYNNLGDIKGSAYRVYQWHDGKFSQIEQ